MAKKKGNFWQENKLDIVPMLYCIGVLAILGGIFVANRHHMEKQYERKRIEKAQAVFDSAAQAKDTIALNAVNTKQK